MSKHKYYDIIVAKAENTELSVLFGPNGGAWREYECGGFPAFSNGDYFLCLPQHKEACLHWLNGGDIEYQDFPTSDWSTISNRGICSWGFDVVFMQDEFNVRIKPRKETRYLFVYPDGSCSGNYMDIDTLEREWNKSDGKLVVTEIEV